MPSTSLLVSFSCSNLLAIAIISGYNAPLWSPGVIIAVTMHEQFIAQHCARYNAFINENLVISCVHIVVVLIVKDAWVRCNVFLPKCVCVGTSCWLVYKTSVQCVFVFVYTDA